MPILPRECSRSLSLSRATTRCFFFELWSTCLDASLRRSIKVIASGSPSCGTYFPFEVDGLGSAVEWDDDRGLAEWRGGWFAVDEVDEARGFRCTAERGFARLAEGSEARGGKDAGEAEEPPESGRR
jgi:hypothetical protein